MNAPPGFATERLDDEHVLFVGELPAELVPDEEGFERLWEMHPNEYQEIHLHGRQVRTPRWMRAYGADYHFSGQVSEAAPVPEEFEPIHDWVRATVDPRLNGFLVIWYDAALGHYIGKHRDSTRNMIEGAPIITISLGAERVFRMRPWKGSGFRDFPTTPGRVFVMPYDTNLAWTHEVPKRASDEGRRISLTLRAFETGNE